MKTSVKKYKKGDQVKLNPDQINTPWGIHIDQIFTIEEVAYEYHGHVYYVTPVLPYINHTRLNQLEYTEYFTEKYFHLHKAAEDVRKEKIKSITDAL